jgi:hypothetical protein
MEDIDFNQYIDLMAKLIDLELKDEYRDGVVANFQRISTIAQVVNEFTLPDDVESSPIFIP